VVDCSNLGLTSIPVFDREESFATWKLILKGNSFPSIPENAFKNLTDLKELDLSDCGIREIKEYSFAGPTRLDKLILKDNGITSLPEHLFHRSSPALTELNVAGNRLNLTELVSATKYLLNLQSLNVEDNGIRDRVMPSDIQHMTGLKFLDLSHNNLGRIDAQFFEHFGSLVQLQTLDLSYNHLRPGVNTFASLPLALEELNLAGNPHLGIQDNLRNTLYGIPNDIDIHILNLSDVGLSGALQAKAFDFVRELNLEVLDLSDNRLSSLDNSELSRKMPYIKELYVSNNKLTSVKSLGDMESLQVLDLSNNSLRSFPSEIFLMPELEEVNLSRNMLKRIAVSRSETLLELKRLDLSRNKISSLIVTGNQRLWRQFPNLRILDLSFNQLFNLDSNMRSLGELETLVLSHNKFSQIHDNIYTVITDMKSLQEVRLNSNPFQCDCQWLLEAQRNIPKAVEVTGLSSTNCKSGGNKAPTVAEFALSRCHVSLPGTRQEVSKKQTQTQKYSADASTTKPSGGLSPGVTALIVLIVLGVLVGAVVVFVKHGDTLKQRLTSGPMSYTEILDEYHPPNGGGVAL